MAAKLYISRLHVYKKSTKRLRAFFCCYSSSDDCLSCVQREFKVEELKKKACLEFDFGEILVMITQFSVLKKGEERCENAQKSQYKTSIIQLLHPNISMHILHTVRYTFPKVLTGRICSTIKSFLSC